MYLSLGCLSGKRERTFDLRSRKLDALGTRTVRFIGMTLAEGDTISGQDLDRRLLRFRHEAGAEDARVLATDLLTAGRFHDASDVLGTLPHADDVSLLLLRGRAQMGSGSLIDAQQSFSLRGESIADSKLPFRWLGELLIRRGDYERAERALMRALDVDPRDDTVQALIARAQQGVREASVRSHTSLRDEVLDHEDALSGWSTVGTDEVVAVAKGADDSQPFSVAAGAKTSGQSPAAAAAAAAFGLSSRSRSQSPSATSTPDPVALPAAAFLSERPGSGLEPNPPTSLRHGRRT